MKLAVKDGNGIIQHMGVSGEGTLADPFGNGPGDFNEEGPALYRYVDTVGDGSGVTNMNVDGSVTPVVFKITPPAGEIYRVGRSIFALRDTGSFDSGGWGSNAGVPLTNGLDIKVKWNGVVSDFGAGNIKSHYDLASVSYDVALHAWGSGDEFLVARLTYTKAGGYIYLDGDRGDELSITVNDDLTYLVDQSVQVQGKIRIK